MSNESYLERYAERRLLQGGFNKGKKLFANHHHKFLLFIGEVILAVFIIWFTFLHVSYMVRTPVCRQEGTCVLSPQK